MIFGGLEIVVGGVVLHHYNKKKNQKRCNEEWNQRQQQRRLNSFPGVRLENRANPQQLQPLQALPPPQYQQQQQQNLAMPYYSPNSPNLPNSPAQLRPHTAQTFPQANPPQPQPHIQIQPQRQFQPQPVPLIQQPVIRPVQRTDTFGTVSNMPVANGLGHPSRDNLPHLPPRPQPPTMYLQPISPQSPVSPISPLGSPYSNMGFSRSTPNFAPSPTQLRNGGQSSFGRNTVDDVDASEQEPLRVHTIRPEEDEDDPPPPYRP